MVVQSLIFPKERFTKRSARTWASSHGYEQAVDEKPRTYRMRQLDPSAFSRTSFRSVEFGTTGIHAVVGKLKGTRGR